MSNHRTRGSFRNLSNASYFHAFETALGSRALVTAAVLLAATFSTGCAKTSAAPATGSAIETPEVKVDSTAKGPNEVPTLTDGSAPSAERVTMETLLARAANENKSLILEVSAAWCGPCNSFATDLDTHPNDLTELSHDGYILVKAESERIVSGGGVNMVLLNDYLPAMVQFFPSFYVYTVKDGWKGLGYMSNYADLKASLAAQAHQSLDSIADLKAYIENPNNSGDKVGQARFKAALFGNVLGSYSYSEAKAILALLKSEDTKFPNKGYASLADAMAGYITGYYGMGLVDIKTLAKDFPALAATVTDASNDSFSTLPYTYQLVASLRTAGLKQTAQQCLPLWTNYRAQVKPGNLSFADYTKKMTGYDTYARWACAELELQATGPTPALKAKVAQLDKTTNKDWKLLAALGDVPAAVAVYHARYKGFADYYDQHLASLKTDLQSAQSTNDKSKIDDDNNEIELTIHQSAYHASVDDEVETDLKANKPVQALHVYN